MRKLLPYIVSLVVLVLLDAAWLSLMMRFYKAQMGSLLLPTPKLPPAILFYLLQALGIQIFVLPRAISRATALAFGAGFGLFTYATYDLTNLAVVSGFSATLVVVDIAWGIVLTALASFAGYLAS